MLLVPILALALAQPVGPQSVDTRTYAPCAATPEPIVCVTDLAVADDRGLELSDLIAAGAVAAARRQAPARGRRVIELAARIAAGEGHEGLSPVEAQHVLAIFSDVSFFDSGLPGDARARGLWDIAMREPVGDIELRGILAQAAGRSGLDDLARRLVAEAPVDGRWSDDERASFAGVAAWSADDWRVAEAFMASGGERAAGYSISETRLGIDQARLRSGYDREAAARVLAAVLAEDELLPWPGDGPEALKAAGANEELRALGAALMSRGRVPDRSPEHRTDDFGLAAWAFRAAGDRDIALAAAREGLAFVPEAVADRSGSVSSFGTWPVRELFELAPGEAVESGLLWDYDRYSSVVKAGGQADPVWVANDESPASVELATSLLRERGDVTAARALLDALDAKLRRPGAGAWDRLEVTDERMTLAAIAGDPEALEAVFNDGLLALDEGEADGRSAIELVIDYREARSLLTAPQTDQSP